MGRVAYACNAVTPPACCGCLLMATLSPVALVGAGSWGTAVAVLVADNGADVRLWCRRKELAETINATRCNHAYLPRVELPQSVVATSDLAEAVSGARLVMVAVPSHAFRDVFGAAVAALAPGVTILSLAKGIEQGSLRRMTEVVAEELPRLERGRVGVLSGPNLASEVAARRPAASVVAMADDQEAQAVQKSLMTAYFRVYTNPDVVGCELAGAQKNVMAIAAGMADGMGLGDNAKAALITRGLAEITRLGVSQGGSPLTFAGLAGMGDLVVTCMSGKSRNRHVGEELGRGRPIAEITAEMSMVAEGVKSTRAIVDLARRAGVEMPIAEQVAKVLYEDRGPEEALSLLMKREAQSEWHGLKEPP
jgi:glycerol-3-phosphate dehydrogenase (NAD(P)+)